MVKSVNFGELFATFGNLKTINASELTWLLSIFIDYVIGNVARSIFEAF